MTAQDLEKALLDRFPVNAAELDVILSAMLPQYESLMADDRGLTSLSTCDPNPVSSRMPDLLNLEKAVPEIPIMFQRSVKTIYVVGIAEQNDKDDVDLSLLHKAKLLEASVSLLGRRGSTYLLRVLFDSAIVPNTSGVFADPNKLLDLVHRLLLASYQFEYGIDDSTKQKSTIVPKAWLHSLKASSGNNSFHLSWAAWAKWATRNAPCIHQVLSTIFHHFLLGPGFAFRPEPFKWLQLQLAEGGPTQHPLWDRAHESIPASLSLMDLGGPWRRLYCSDNDGLSFRTMQQALTGYEGPTALLIQTLAGDCLGYFTSTTWSSSKWVGGSDSDSFLFQLHPSLIVYPTTTTGASRKNRQYLHTPVSRQDKSMSGLAVGGIGVDCPRLHITESLEDCKATTIDMVFESGPLLSDENESFFDVDLLQVWAVRCATDEKFLSGLNVGRLRNAIRDARCQSWAKVDRRQFLDDLRSESFMNSLFDHRQHTRGRHEFVAKEKP